MNDKYTSEHFSELLNDLCSACSMIGYATSGNERQNHRATKDKIKAEIIDAVAALLRERESAKAGVTEETTQIAFNAYNKSLFAGSYGPDDGQPICHDYTLAMRAALEAVAPMLARAQVPDKSMSLLQEAHSSLSRMIAKSEDADINEIEVLARLADALTAASKPEKE